MRYRIKLDSYKQMDEEDLRQNRIETDFFQKRYSKTLSDIDYSILRCLKEERKRLENDYRYNWAPKSQALT